MTNERVISIVRLAGQWAVLDGGKELKRFDYRVDAEEKALRLERPIRAQGVPANADKRP